MGEEKDGELIKKRDAAPNQTIYVRNLSEKLKKDDLRRSLYECFSPYGRILDIVALKTQKMRGQAFIAFEDVASAANAMSYANGMVFYNKPMVIHFAREKCERVSRLLGKSGQPKEKRKRDGMEVDRENTVEEKEGDEKKVKTEEAKKGGEETAAAGNEEDIPPNNILFIQNIPDDVDSDTLTELFGQFRGFVEVRSAQGRKGIAFLEFASVDNAEIALKSMQGFQLSDTAALKLSFAKS